MKRIKCILRINDTYLSKALLLTKDKNEAWHIEGKNRVKKIYRFFKSRGVKDLEIIEV